MQQTVAVTVAIDIGKKYVGGIVVRLIPLQVSAGSSFQSRLRTSSNGLQLRSRINPGRRVADGWRTNLAED